MGGDGLRQLGSALNHALKVIVVSTKEVRGETNDKKRVASQAPQEVCKSTVRAVIAQKNDIHGRCTAK